MNAEAKARWAWGAPWSINATLPSCLSSWGSQRQRDHQQRPRIGIRRNRIGIPCAPKPTAPTLPCAVAVMTPHSAIGLDNTADGWGGSCVRTDFLLEQFQSQNGLPEEKGAVSFPSSVVFKTPSRKTAFGI